MNITKLIKKYLLVIIFLLNIIFDNFVKSKNNDKYQIIQ